MRRIERSIGSTCAPIDELVVEDNTKLAIQIYERVRSFLSHFANEYSVEAILMLFDSQDVNPSI